MNQLLALLNVLLPPLLAQYKRLRDANPNQPSLTDEQVIELLGLDADRIARQADEWLASHPASDV